MNQHSTNFATNDGQIFLLDVCRIIIARKWLVLLFPVLAVLTAVSYLAMTKSVFECRASILVGQVGEGNFVKNPAVIVQYVSEKYRVRDRTVKRSYPRVVAVDFDKKDSNSVVIIKVADFTPKGAKAYLFEIVEDILLDQKQLYEENLQMKNEYLQTLTAQIAANESYQKQLDTHIDQTAKKDPAQAAVLALERGQLLAIIPDLVEQQYQLRASINNLDSYPAHLLSEPQLPENPVRPRRALVLLLALISGGISGITAAFIAEVIKFGRTENLTVMDKN